MERRDLGSLVVPIGRGQVGGIGVGAKRRFSRLTQWGAAVSREVVAVSRTSKSSARERLLEAVEEVRTGCLRRRSILVLTYVKREKSSQGPVHGLGFAGSEWRSAALWAVTSDE